jgi:hypothetical protein
VTSQRHQRPHDHVGAEQRRDGPQLRAGTVDGEVERSRAERVDAHEVCVDLDVNGRDRPVAADVEPARQPQQRREPVDDPPPRSRQTAVGRQVAPRRSSGAEPHEAGELDEPFRWGPGQAGVEQLLRTPPVGAPAPVAATAEVVDASGVEEQVAVGGLQLQPVSELVEQLPGQVGDVGPVRVGERGDRRPCPDRGGSWDVGRDGREHPALDRADRRDGHTRDAEPVDQGAHDQQGGRDLVDGGRVEPG